MTYDSSAKNRTTRIVNYIVLIDKSDISRVQMLLVNVVSKDIVHKGQIAKENNHE